MKIHSQIIQVRPEYKTANSKPKKEIQFDFIKWIALLITLIGIGAWIAGESFNNGYWNAIGDIGPVIQPTLQQTAFTGFAGPTENWIYAAIIVALSGLFILFLSLRSIKEKKPNRFVVWITNFVKKRIKIDTETAGVSGVLMAAAYLFVALIIFPAALWILGAYNDGKNKITKVICEARATKEFPTNVILGDGTKLSGKSLGHSEKLNILLDRSSVYLISISDKPQILSVTSTLGTNCPGEKIH